MHKISVIGLGYVGLPLAVELARYYDVIGFDINPKKIDLLRSGKDPSKELDDEVLRQSKLRYTDIAEDLRDATIHIVAVPTPIDSFKNPDLSPLLSACKTVGAILKKGDIVCFESTVYPGCTEEDCVPELEQHSGLSFPDNFQVGYSPERINPGDKVHTVDKIVKVVAASNSATLKLLAEIYGKVTDAGIHRAPTIKVAEAAKVIENTQRDVNISLMNELSLIFKKMDINTFDVLEAAGTKWNFLNFFPGLVGGHCIGVDPYYLTYKANQLGYSARVILSGRSVNDNMAATIAREVLQHLIQEDFRMKDARILVIGATFKENVSDFRNSKVADLVRELQSFSLKVDLYDPLVDAEDFEASYGLKLIDQPREKYDALILAVNHDAFNRFSADDLEKMVHEKGLIYDLRGKMRKNISGRAYRSL